jgi:hypothetical protein
VRENDFPHWLTSKFCPLLCYDFDMNIHSLSLLPRVFHLRLSFVVSAVILGLLFLLSYAIVGAQPVEPGGLVPCEGTECGACHFIELGNNILNWLIGVMMIIFAIIVAYTGFLLVTSSGNVETKNKVKRMFTNALTGLIILLAAWIVVDTIMRALMVGEEGKIRGYGPWSRIECGAQVTPVAPGTVVGPPAVSPAPSPDDSWEDVIVVVTPVDDSTTVNPGDSTESTQTAPSFGFDWNTTPSLRPGEQSSTGNNETGSSDQGASTGGDEGSGGQTGQIGQNGELEVLLASTIYDCGQLSLDYLAGASNIQGSTLNYTLEEYITRYASRYGTDDALTSAVEESLSEFGNELQVRCVAIAIAGWANYYDEYGLATTYLGTGSCESAVLTVARFSDWTLKLYIAERNDGVCGFATGVYPTYPEDPVEDEGTQEMLLFCSLTDVLNTTVSPEQQKTEDEWKQEFGNDPGGTLTKVIVSIGTYDMSIDCVDFLVDWELWDDEMLQALENQDTLLASIDTLLNEVDDILATTTDPKFEEIRSELVTLAQAVELVSPLDPDAPTLLSSYSSAYLRLRNEVRNTVTVLETKETLLVNIDTLIENIDSITAATTTDLGLAEARLELEALSQEVELVSTADTAAALSLLATYESEYDRLYGVVFPPPAEVIEEEVI